MGVPLIAAAVLGTAAIGVSAHQAREQKKIQEEQLRRQRDANFQQMQRALSAQRRSQAESRAANRRGPDVASLLGRERNRALFGPGSTLLTGPKGAPNNSLLLGSKSLLGS